MAAILSVKTADGQWIEIPAIVGAPGKDGKDGKDGVDRVEVPAQLFDIPVLLLEDDTTAMDKEIAGRE